MGAAGFLKVGSHDPIFASKCSLVHFFIQELDVYSMEIEYVLFSFS